MRPNTAAAGTKPAGAGELVCDPERVRRAALPPNQLGADKRLLTILFP
jgi:hypothetical protein